MEVVLDYWMDDMIDFTKFFFVIEDNFSDSIALKAIANVNVITKYSF